MANDEIGNIRIQLMQANQQLSTYQQENARLNQRVTELYDWSQQAQIAIQERDSQIQTLIAEIQNYKNQENQRKQQRSEMTMDDLYDKVQRLEMTKRDMESKVETYFSIIEDSYIKSQIDRPIESRIEQIFRKVNDPKLLLLIEMKKNPSFSIKELSKKTGIPENQVNIAADQLRRRGLVREFDSVHAIAFTQGGSSTSYSDTTEWPNIKSPKELFNALIEYVRISDQHRDIHEALKVFRDALTSLIGTPSFMYSISKLISDYRISMGVKADLIREIVIWQEKYEANQKGVETYGTSIDDPSSWNTGLSPEELFSSFGRYIKTAKNHEIAPALEKVRDILHEKHGHAIYLTEIAREASKWKMSPQNRNELSGKLSSWLEHADSRT